MALDMAKYRKLFLEESAEHLSEISRALLELEKDSASAESIDVRAARQLEGSLKPYIAPSSAIGARI